MLVFYILLACLILWGIRFAPRGSYYADCLSRDATLPIKGVFILWVFLCHAMGYLMESGCEFQRLVMLPLAFLAPDFVRAYPAAIILIGLTGTVVFVSGYRLAEGFLAGNIVRHPEDADLQGGRR